MANSWSSQAKILADDIIELDRQSLCELVSKLCLVIKDECGLQSFRGGIFPENISIDENGEIAIGSAKPGDWQGPELQFIAPELYWNRTRGQAADVYSLGLLLYYATSGGKFPYEGESRDFLVRRMGGDDFDPPSAAGRRLGEIIAKATRFKPEERYQNVEQLRIMLDNCVKNLYLSGAAGSKALFNKDDDDLSEIERMMIGIIEGEPEAAAVEAELEISDEPDEEQELEAELAAEPEEIAEDTAEAETSDNDIVKAAFALWGESENQPQAEQEQATAEEATLPEQTEEEPAAEEIEESEETEAAEESEAAEETEEEVLVYDPESEKKRSKQEDDAAVAPIPVLTVEENPELEPVVIKKPAITPAVQYGKSAERERKIATAAKRRRRKPVVQILVLCIVLVLAAIIINAFIKDLEEKDNPTEPSAALTPGVGSGVVIVPTAAPSAEPSGEPSPELPKESTYQVFKEDVSWQQAQARCAELGGHLAVISDIDEFNKVVGLVEAAGISRAWVGCHRVDGTLVWETEDEVTFWQWDANEPSYVDGYDGTAEDYLLLWDNNGWKYNDSRNDPVSDYPAWYSGTIGFVCEFEG